MNCMRCGRETAGQQVFCESCLDDMSRHPVKPDVAIYLPVRKPSDPQRKQSRSRRKEITAEELVPILRRRILVLAATVVILVLMLAAAFVGVWFAHNPQAEEQIPNIGQNYQTVETDKENSSGG